MHLLSTQVMIVRKLALRAYAPASTKCMSPTQKKNVTLCAKLICVSVLADTDIDNWEVHRGHM